MSQHRIRVLTLLSGLLIGQTGGGADKFGLEVARRLDQERFEPVICAFWRRGDATEEHWRQALSADGVRTFFGAERGSRFSMRQYLAGLRRISAEVAPGVDIIHSHFQLGSLAAVLLRGQLGARGLVRTAHGTVWHEWSRRPVGRLSRLVFTRSLFPFVFEQEVGVSRASTESLNRRWATRISGRAAITIPNAIAQDVAGCVDRDAARQELGLHRNDIMIGSVGRLSEQKGYTYLLHAAPRILQRFPAAQIILIGDGELRPALEDEVRRLGLVDKVRFLGVRTDVAELYSIMDLFVLPSLWEGLPTVVLEAMAHGVPMVATDISGTRDLVVDGQTGWLARAGDTDDLARVVIGALEKKALWPQMTERAAAETLRPYRIEDVTRRYEMLFMSIIEGRRHPSYPQPPG